MTDSDFFRICAQSYYWKPMQAFFSVLTLRTYRRLELRFDSPVLDLGCSDGLFGQLLSRAHGGFAIDAGFDIDPAGVRRARTSPFHKRVVQADARNLPYPPGTFTTIFSNGVLCCVPGGVDRPLSEIARILRPGGTVLFTMPTPSFTRILLMPRLLERVGMASAAQRYVDRLNARLHHLNVLDASDLTQRVEAAGLKVESVTPFFLPREARVWDLLAQQPVRVFGALRAIPGGGWVARWPVQAFLRLVSSRDERESDENGYMLVRAKKPQ